MPQQNFNISRLLARVGDKNIIEMPLTRSIQATIPLGSMYGQVPVHVAGVAMFGGATGAIVDERAAYEIVCLDPGGGVLQWFDYVGNAKTMRLDLSATPLVWTTGPTIQSNLNFTNEPTLSFLRMGHVSDALSDTQPSITDLHAGDFGPLYVPRGSHVQLVMNSANDAANYYFAWCGISATEGGE